MAFLSTESRSLSIAVASLLLGASLAGCVTQDASASTGSLYVKDALTDEAAEVHVTFTRAEVLPAQAQAWETVFQGNETIDLLSLTSSEAKEKLSGFEIEPGEYSRMRLAVSNVTVVHHNGTTEDLVVFGNTVTVAHNLSFEPGEPLNILMDVDLAKGVNLTRGEFVPVVADVQTSDVDTDGDGVSDFNDTDDDGDGIEDAKDDDRDGDGQPDLPKQSQAMDRNGLFGLCTAWKASETGRMHAANGTDAADDENASEQAENQTAGNQTDEPDENETAENETAENETAEPAGNASAADNRSAKNRSAADEPHAFDWLKKQADEAGRSVEAYCEAEASRPGPPSDLSDIGPDELPEQARQAMQGRHLGPPDQARGGPEDRPGQPGGNETGQDRAPDRANRSGQEDRGGNQSQGDGGPGQTGGNQSAPGQSGGGGPGNQTGGPPDGRP